MAQKQVTYRLSAEGGGQVKAEFQGIGAAGDAAFDKVSRSTKSASASAAVFEQALQAEQRQFEALRASVDPAFAAIQRFERAQVQADAAVRRGIASQADADDVLRRMSGSMAGVGRSARPAAHDLQNLAFQLNQVGQQGLVTGNYLQAFATQLPDVLSVFGGVKGVVAGAVAGFALGFVPALLDAESASEDAATAMDDLLNNLDRFVDFASVAATPIDELTEKFGDFADEVQRSSRVAAQASLSQAMQNVSEASSSIRDGMADLTKAQDTLMQRTEQLRTVQRVLGARTLTNASAWDEAESAVSAASAAMVDAADAMGLSVSQSFALSNALKALSDADGMDDVARAAADALDVLQAMKFESGQIPAEIQDIIFALDDVLKSAAAGVVAFDDIGDSILTAAGYAERLAKNAQMAAAQAAAARNYEGREDVLPIEVGPGSTWGPAVPPQIVMPPVVTRASRRPSSGGSARAQSEEDRAALRIKEAVRTAQERFNEELALADKLLKSGAISTTEHTRYTDQLADQLANATREQERFGEVARTVEDSVIDGLMGQADAADRLKEALKRAALEYLVFGQGMFAPDGGVMGGGLLGRFVGGLVGGLPSFDGGGYTGNSPRSGGLDGRGGFLAVMHPQEHVEDLTRGTAAGRAASELVITLAPELRGQIRAENRDLTLQLVQSGLHQTSRAMPGRLAVLEERGV